MDEQIFRRVNPRDYLRRFLSKQVRPDGRAPSTPRKLSLTTGSISTALGSAMVKLGRTTAVAGAHATLVPPLPNSPEDGIFDTVVEVLPTANLPAAAARGFKHGDEAVALSHQLRSWVHPYVKLADLCIEKGKLVWHVRVTVYCIDNDGNLDDAVVLAAVAAIRDIRLPNVRMLQDADDDANDEHATDDTVMTDDAPSYKLHASSAIAVASEERNVPLTADGLPIVVSFAIFDNTPLIDPCGDEEAVADSKLTMVFRPTGDLRAVEMPGGKHLPQEVLDSCMRQAKERVATLADRLNGR